MLPLANWYHSQAVGPISLAPEGDDVHYLSLTKLAQGCCNRLIFFGCGWQLLSLRMAKIAIRAERTASFSRHRWWLVVLSGFLITMHHTVS